MFMWSVRSFEDGPGTHPDPGRSQKVDPPILDSTWKASSLEFKGYVGSFLGYFWV